MAGSHRKTKPPPQRLILDSGAVIALSRADQRARAFVARALELGAAIEIPVVVVAETVRGGPHDAPVHRVLEAVDAVPAATEAVGRTAGQLLGKTRSAATMNALVVAQAVHAGGGHVLTSDPDDLVPLAASHPQVWIHAL